MAYYNYIIHLDLVRNNKLFYIRRKEMNDICEYCKEDIGINEPSWYNPIDYDDKGQICDQCMEEDIKDTENLLRHEIEQIQGE